MLFKCQDSEEATAFHEPVQKFSPDSQDRPVAPSSLLSHLWSCVMTAPTQSEEPPWLPQPNGVFTSGLKASRRFSTTRNNSSRASVFAAKETLHLQPDMDRRELNLSISGVASPKFWGAKVHNFRRITLFCLERRLSEHKMTIFSKTFWGAWPLWLLSGYAYTIN